MLHSPFAFWFALFAKLVPHLWRPPIRLRLKRGGEFDVNEFMTLYIYKEIFVDGCYDFPRLPGNEPAIIDIGANTGLFAIRMMQIYPHAKLFAYEPMPGNYRQLQGNLRVSKIADCMAFQEGVGGRARAEKLFIHSRNVGGHSIYADIASSDKSIEIQLVDIRTALDRLQGRVCNLLKLDCEGAEYEIMKSLDKEAARRIERIIFEPTPTMYNIEELKLHLDEIGYHVQWNDGIFVALRRDVMEQA